MEDKIMHMEDKIIIPLHKHIAVLYPSEIQKLLLTDEELYIKAMKRGKNEKRYQVNEYRESRAVESQSPKRTNK